jgi:hypothetical protein
MPGSLQRRCTVVLLALLITPAGCRRSPTAPEQPGGILSIASVVPARGVPGTSISIVGTGFVPGTRVSVGGTPATLTGFTARSLAVTAPHRDGGLADILVTNPDGRTSRLAEGFEYLFTAPAPSISSLSTGSGSTAGGTYIEIRGTGFQRSTRVTFDGVEARIMYQTSADRISLTTRPHGPGTVNLLVTNPDGQVDPREWTYTYTLPPFSDFNGEWEGRAGDENETSFSFRVENDLVVAVSCGSRRDIRPSPASPTTGGQFTARIDGLVSMTGALLSAGYAEGTVALPACTYDTYWFAHRR